jgi:hypothetical protein
MLYQNEAGFAGDSSGIDIGIDVMILDARQAGRLGQVRLG